MDRVELLRALKIFTEACTADLLMPTRLQNSGESGEERAAEVHLMRLPDSKAAKKKAPYIIHQAITSSDSQNSGERPESRTTVRSIFCVYSPNEEEGALMLLNLMERLRINLLKQELLSDRFQLDLSAAMESLIYPDDTAPYYMGEMSSTWKLPPVVREVRWAYEPVESAEGSGEME